MATSTGRRRDPIPSLSSPRETSTSSLKKWTDLDDTLDALESRSFAASTRYEGVDITFRDATVSMSKKVILDGASGYVHRGSLTALMVRSRQRGPRRQCRYRGRPRTSRPASRPTPHSSPSDNDQHRQGPSGSGKTTLVDCLTFRNNTGKRSGTILYDGQKPNAAFLRHAVSYVEQVDSLIENLTVAETMRYNLDLINGGRRLSKEDAEERIDSVLRHVLLDGCKDVPVGSALQRGISGGQRKRLNIAINLLRRPSVLVLDEPTSGLDSYTAFEVLLAVKSLSVAGLTVLSTIHAPSTSIFHLFDRLMVVLDGRMVYAGDVSSDQIHGFFRGCDVVGQVGRGALDAGIDGGNTADWLTAVVVQTSRLKQSDKLADYYASSDQKRSVDARIDKIVEKNLSVSSPSSSLPTPPTQTFLQKTGIHSTWVIIKHRVLPDYRRLEFMLPRVADKFAFGVIILTLYWGIGKPLGDDADDTAVLAHPIQITTALFMWSLLPVFGSVSAIPSIFEERVLFNRERQAGYYNSGSYLSAKVFEEACVNAVTSAVLSTAVWFALGLTGQFPVFWLVYFVTSMVGVTLSYLFASLSPNTEMAIIGASAINIVLLFFTGLLIRIDDIPSYWKWLVDINHLHYGWGACMKNQFTPEDSFGGVAVLEYFSLDNGASAWVYLLYEFCFVIVFFLAGVLSLRWMNYSKR